MSSALPPTNGTKFVIKCNARGDDVAVTTTCPAGQCTVSPIHFVGQGGYGDFDLWTWQQVPGTNGNGFKNVATQAWISRVNGNVVTCAIPDASCVWSVVDQHDGSSLVNVSGADIIWQVRPNGDMGLGSARTQITDDKKFSFEPVYY